MSMEDTLYTVIAMEAAFIAERKLNVNVISLGAKYLFQCDSTSRAKGVDNLV